MSQKKTMDSRQKDLNLATKKPRTDARKSKNVERNKFLADANKQIVAASNIPAVRNAKGKLKRNSKLVRTWIRQETHPTPQLDKDGAFVYGSDYTPPKQHRKVAA